MLGVVIARAFGTGHAALYAVLMASSSAALILPIVSSLRLGASLDFAQLFTSPSFAGLGLALGVGAVVAHVAMRLLAQPVSMGALASAQLGVPVAAATVGDQLGVLAPGESAALILGALVTIAVTAIAGGTAIRQGLVAAAHEARKTDREADGETDRRPLV